MKKTLIAGALVATATMLLCGCSGEGGSGAPQNVEKRPPVPEAEKVKPPEAVVQEGLKSSKEPPADMPKKKTGG